MFAWEWLVDIIICCEWQIVILTTIMTTFPPGGLDTQLLNWHFARSENFWHVFTRKWKLFQQNDNNWENILLYNNIQDKMPKYFIKSVFFLCFNTKKFKGICLLYLWPDPMPILGKVRGCANQGGMQIWWRCRPGWRCQPGWRCRPG